MKTNYAGHDSIYKKHRSQGKAGWDANADSINETKAILEKALQSEHVPKKGKLLELGCGAGNITLWLAEKGYEGYGTDIAPTAIDWAKEKAGQLNIKCDFQVGNVLDLKEYKDNSFDFVLDGHCFHCIIGEHREMFLKSVRRVLKPDGFFLINTMCGEVAGKEMKKTFDSTSRLLIENGVASRYIGLPDDIIDEVKKAGFSVLHSEIIPRKNDEDMDTLLVYSVKTGRL